MGEMIVTDVGATLQGGGDDDGHERAAARAYPPGSRLRRALDLARKSAAVDEPPAPAPSTIHAIGTQMPSLLTAESSGAESAVPARASTRRGLGRGLDALLPPAGGAADVEPETWETSAQGWVRTADDTLEWRPIVTTLQTLDMWQVATYLGVVSGQAAIPPAADRLQAAWARREAVRLMVDEALARGAHGVVGVSLHLAETDSDTVVTAAGTAVTLGHRR